MPALAIARATQSDQQVIAAPIGEMPGRVAQADLPGPTLIFLGRVCSQASAVTASRSAEPFTGEAQAVQGR